MPGITLVVYYKDLFDNEYLVQCNSDTNTAPVMKGERNWDAELEKIINKNVKRAAYLTLTNLQK